MKHASCIGGELTKNKTAFFERAGEFVSNDAFCLNSKLLILILGSQNAHLPLLP